VMPAYEAFLNSEQLFTIFRGDIHHIRRYTQGCIILRRLLHRGPVRKNIKANITRDQDHHQKRSSPKKNC
jgi:hypothetical protein